MYDIVIINGRVMDPETKMDSFRSVGIKNGIIAIITKEVIDGHEVIDAKGHVVTAGFIDTHVHSSNKYNIEMSMLDGVTTGLDLEGGAVNIEAWYDREKGKWPMNYGQSVCQEVVRMMIHEELNITQPSDASDLPKLRALTSTKEHVPEGPVSVSELDHINEITKILDENLRQGALGVGSFIEYASTGISTYEMFEAQKAAARYGRLTAVHTQFNASSKPLHGAPLGFDEVFTNACVLQAPLLICHDNDYDWWEIEEKLALARDMGMNMWAEYYPYDSSSTSIDSELLKPVSFDDIMGLTYEEVIYDPHKDKFLNKEEYLQLVKEDPERTIIGYNPARKEWMNQWIKIPHMTVASDAVSSTNGSHNGSTGPSGFSMQTRTSGTHATILRQGREAGIPLLFTLSQLSYWSALHLGNAGLTSMQNRGRMQEGMAADIVIFNPNTAREGSTYESVEHSSPSIGIPHVIVNGVIVKKDNKPTDKFPGQPIRYPVQEQGKFIPATKKQWLKTHTIDTRPVKI